MKTNRKATPELELTLYRPVGLARSVKTMADIGEDQLKQYGEEGYILVEQFLNEAEVQTCKEALTDIVYGRASGRVQYGIPIDQIAPGVDRELEVRKIHDFAGVESRLQQVIDHPHIHAVLEKIFSEKAKLAQEMALMKPAHGGGEKPWHQDMAYGALAWSKAVCGVWIALDDAEVDNGCMRIIPRSHMEGAIPHYAVRDWQICDTNITANRVLAAPVRAGGVLIFHGLLHHGTPTNNSANRRRSLQHHYAPVSAEKLSPQEYKRLFTNEMTGAEC